MALSDDPTPVPPPPAPRREGRFARLRRIWSDAGVSERTHTLRPGSGPHPQASALPQADDYTPEELRALVDVSWLPASAVWMAAGIRLAIVGESNYQPELRLCVDCDDWGCFGTAALLRTEPENPYDKNAVAVILSTGCVGYIARDDLPKWRPFVAAQEELGRVPVVTASIIGGGEHDYGLWLHISSDRGEHHEALEHPTPVITRAA